MTDVAVPFRGPGSESAISAIAKPRIIPAILFIAGVALLLASPFLPWAVVEGTGIARNAFDADLPWLLGGSDMGAGEGGSFANGWLILIIAALCAAVGCPLLAMRRMAAIPVAAIGAMLALCVYFTEYRFEHQYGLVADALPGEVSMGEGWWVALVGSLLLVLTGVTARIWLKGASSVAGAGGPVTLDSLSGDRDRHDRESGVRALVFLAALASVLVSGLIVWSLVREAFVYMFNIDWGSVWSTGWFPRQGFFDIKTLIVSTLLVNGVAMLIATPIGLGSAVFLSEYAKPRTRRILKPTLEVLASIPSVVLGYFALQWISPNVVQAIDGWFGQDAHLGNLAAAGIGVGILSSPLMASISEDAMKAVPNSLREASAGLGSRKVTTTLRVVLPAAVSGLVAAFIVTSSRAVGETMVVFIAGGGGDTAVYTHNIFDGSLTMTAAMASLASGTDNVVGEGLTFESLYFVGLLLFVMTLAMNLVADRFVSRVRNKY